MMYNIRSIEPGKSEVLKSTDKSTIESRIYIGSAGGGTKLLGNGN